MSIIANTADCLAHLRHKTILLSGVSGYLGSALLSILQTIPCRIIALSRRSLDLPASQKSAELIVFERDLAQPDAWSEPLGQGGVDVVFHLAAHEHRQGSLHAPTADLAVNAASVLHLLENCRQLNYKPQIVFASSTNVVGCPARLPVDETCNDRPLTLYAIHKLTAERYLQHYARAFGIPSVALRFTNVYGCIDKEQLEIASRVVLNRVMKMALAGEPLKLFSNRGCRRDFVYITDALKALCLAASQPNLTDGSPYIIGSEEGLPLQEIIHLIAEQVAVRLGWRPEIQTQEQVSLEPVEWREFVADCTRMRLATGWTPQVRLREGIGQTLQQMQSEMAL